MLLEETQTLLEVAQWTATHRNLRCTIRQLAGTEEIYQLLIRELDRVERQCFRARTLHAEATLSLVEWIEVLNYFHWRCAYCQEQPVQVMSHFLPISQAGTTALNCLPACYRCRHNPKKENERIQSYFAQLRTHKEHGTSVPAQ